MNVSYVSKDSQTISESFKASSQLHTNLTFSLSTLKNLFRLRTSNKEKDEDDIWFIEPSIYGVSCNKVVSGIGQAVIVLCSLYSHDHFTQAPHTQVQSDICLSLLQTTHSLSLVFLGKNLQKLTVLCLAESVSVRVEKPVC